MNYHQNMSGSEEKAYTDHVSGDRELRGVESRVPRVEDFDFTPDEQRKIMRRIDRRLVVTVGLMYCVSLMDRTNLGSANIAGMSFDLRLDIGTRYVGFAVTGPSARPISDV